MQSTGHSSTQARSFRSTHGWAMTYVTGDTPRFGVRLPTGGATLCFSDLVSRARPVFCTEVQLRKAWSVTSSRSRRLTDAAVGERWVIRARLPDGSATDLIGWLEVLDPTTLQLVTADETLHGVERSTI